jgi:hypothetical protein
LAFINAPANIQLDQLDLTDKSMMNAKEEVCNDVQSSDDESNTQQSEDVVKTKRKTRRGRKSKKSKDSVDQQEADPLQ